MFRRDKDARRTANSVRTHQKTMEAFGRASDNGEKRIAEREKEVYLKSKKPKFHKN